MPVINQPEIQSFLDYLKFEKRYSVHTIRSYQDDLAQFFTFLLTEFGKTALKNISHSYVRSWLASLKEQGLTARSINRKISTLKSFFKFLLKQDVIMHTPMANVISPKTRKRLPAFIKQDDIAGLLATMKNNTEDWDGLNTKMLFTLFYTDRKSTRLNSSHSQISYAVFCLKKNIGA